MNEEQKEEVLQGLEGAANFMRGMMFDGRIPEDVKKALLNKSIELDKIAKKYV